MIKTTKIMTSMTIAAILIGSSGSFSGLVQQSFATPPTGPCPDGTKINLDTLKCETDPTCEFGSYDIGTNQCEWTESSATTCPDGTSLNETTDKCEPISVDPQCPVDYTYDSDTDDCTSLTESSVPAQCPIGTTLNGNTEKCEGPTSSDPTCDTGVYNADTNQCEEPKTSDASCSVGTLNTDTDQCETNSEGKIPLCHVAGKGKLVNIVVNVESLKGHVSHGDTLGSCP